MMLLKHKLRLIKSILKASFQIYNNEKDPLKINKIYDVDNWVKQDSCHFTLMEGAHNSHIYDIETKEGILTPKEL